MVLTSESQSLDHGARCLPRNHVLVAMAGHGHLERLAALLTKLEVVWTAVGLADAGVGVLDRPGDIVVARAADAAALVLLLRLVALALSQEKNDSHDGDGDYHHCNTDTDTNSGSLGQTTASSGDSFFVVFVLVLVGCRGGSSSLGLRCLGGSRRYRCRFGGSRGRLLYKSAKMPPRGFIVDLPLLLKSFPQREPP